MVDFNKIADKAKQLASQRGGVDGVKQDAERLRDIAKGDGSATDKLRGAAQALREPHESDSEAEGVAEKIPGAPTERPVADPASPAEGVAAKIPDAPHEHTSDPEQRDRAAGVASEVPGAPEPG